MADSGTIRTEQITLTGGGTADPITISGGDRVWIKNPTGNAAVYVGDENVTSSNGYILEATDEFEFDFIRPMTVYVVGTGAEVVYVATTAN